VALVAARRRAVIVALATILSATLTAGSCQPQDSADQPPPDTDVSYEEAPPTPAGSEDPHNRQNVVPVPKGTSPRAVEFADANTGYALFSSCVSGQPCQVGLVFTLDGGSSWVPRKLPFDDATEVDMRLGRGNVLIVKAIPHGYYISRDSGRTFQQRPLVPPAPELGLADPPYRAGCPDLAATECLTPQLLQVGDDGVTKALPGRPAGDHGQFTSLVAQADGKLWMSAQTSDGGTPLVITVSVWSSTDRGKTWRPEGVAHPTDVTVEPHLVVSPDGSDVWLAGARFAARHSTAGGTWTEAPAMREFAELFSAEVLPGGELLVATGQGVWLLDQQQRVRDTGARLVFRLRRLSDGTILGYPAQQSGEVWLCTPQNRKCDWSRVAVSGR
jgi:hypothetical protein